MRHIPKIGSVMTPFPHSIESHEQLGRAKALMEDHEVRHLPVKRDGKLFGVITGRDIERAQLLSIGLRSSELRVEDVCERNVFAVPFETPLDSVLDAMQERRTGCAIVEHHGNVAGIFTTMDACARFCDFLREGRDTPHGGGAA
jgi:acetoin utilization protein AcuB